MPEFDAWSPHAQVPGGAPPEPAASAPAPRRHRRGLVALVLLIVIGVAALAGGATALVLEFARHATDAEAQAAATAEISSRWQRLPAGQIFPAQLSFTDRTGLTVPIDRIGIAPTAACAQTADPAVAQALVSAGCVTMVRATYVDDTGTQHGNACREKDIRC
jgi:hypothetical protein